MQLFIDTNVYLTFYHLTSEDLDELKKLSLLVREKKISLLLPEQTSNEFERNREVKISDALKQFQANNFNKTIPQIFKDYEKEYGILKRSIKEYEETKQLLLSLVTNDIKNRTLKADKIIHELFNDAILISTTNGIISNARIRYDLGNPPGKHNSVGDQVIWETLLAFSKEKEDLFFITDDKDYFSEFDNELFNSFLLKEWNSKKSASIIFYKRLSSYFKVNYPEIIIASDYEKDTLISKLSNSGTFAATHSIIQNLSEFEDFSTKQANDIIYAGITNNQIFWIGKDPDVNIFMNKIYDKYNDSIAKEYSELFLAYYRSSEEQNDDEDIFSF